MLKALLASLLMAAALGGHAQSIQGRSLSGPVHKEMAYLFQDVVLAGDTVLNAGVAPLTSSNAGFGTTKMVLQSTGSPVGVMPRIPVPNPVTQTAALVAAVNWTRDDLPVFKTAVSRWLLEKGLSVAVYNYNQEIMVSTEEGPKRRAIAFNATIDSKGKATYGAPKIVDPDPTLVEAVYTPRLPAAGLPTNWAYPDAGTLKWRVLNKRYEAITGWRTADVNGAYDEAEDGTDSRLACLVDARNPPGCSTPHATMRTLIDQVGAAYGLLSYIKQLEPIYEDVDPVTGEGSAVAAITVDARRWDCRYYYNSGHYGFLLALVADTYMIRPQTTKTEYTLVSQEGGVGMSPAAPYSKQVPVAALNGTHPDTVIISPEPTSNDLWLRSNPVQMRNVIYVAPVVSELAGMGVGFTGSPTSEGAMGGGNTRTYYLGNNIDNNLGWTEGEVFDQNFYFSLNSPNDLEFLRLKNAAVDDWLLIAINGTVLWIGPYGGTKLELTSGTLWGLVMGESCSPGWTCGYYQYMGDATNVVTTTTEQGTTNTGTCPAGQTYYETRCYGYRTVNYASCLDYGNGTWSCSNSPCGPNMVDYGTGCGTPEQRFSRKFDIYQDMLPYVRAGQNHIYMRAIVGGYGEAYAEIEARMCGSELELENSAPPGPGAPAVTGNLTPRAEDIAGAGP